MYVDWTGDGPGNTNLFYVSSYARVADPQPVTPVLAATGVDVSGAVGLAVIALVLGGTAIIVRRRSRSGLLGR